MFLLAAVLRVVKTIELRHFRTYYGVP